MATKVALATFTAGKMKKLHPRYFINFTDKNIEITLRHYRHEEMQDRYAQRRAALIPDSQTISEIKHVAAKTAGKVALASVKLRRIGFRKPQRFVTKNTKLESLQLHSDAE